jgi:hypothetical protein
MEIDEITLAKLVRVYIKIRTARQELMTKYEDELEKLDADMTKIKKSLLGYCKERNVESVRTTEGLFYRTVKQRYTTNDWESMGKFVMENNIPEIYEKRLNQGNMKIFLEQNPDKLPPGLNVDSEYQITIRRK